MQASDDQRLFWTQMREVLRGLESEFFGVFSLIVLEMGQ
jgi:hypothetical protein